MNTGPARRNEQPGPGRAIAACSIVLAFSLTGCIINGRPSSTSPSTVTVHMTAPSTPITNGSAGGAGSAFGAPPASATQNPSATPNSLPDADSHGFLNYNGAARCGGSDPASLMVRTAQSAAVVCQSGPAAFYYRGLRLSDGATIELTGATRMATGFIVTNPSDGTEYDVTRSELVIRSTQGVDTESVIESGP